MIVKFHARGRGGGAGPVDYLLGKDRQRVGASVLQGKPEEVRELIDASPYTKKYTSGVLSFAEQDVPPGQREALMDSFERVLMPGLDKDQYSVLWVEHQDKGRLELNFVIPNTELLTGKRLQPYFDRADRPRIDAWQTLVNDRLGLHDPNAPENRRALVTPSTLPTTKQDAAEAITDGLLRLCETGEVKTRQDVLATLSGAGFEVVRTTKNSISLADPDGGRNIRLKGAIYEQAFEAGDGLRAEISRAGERYRADAEARVQRARTVCQRGTDLKREENQRRHSRSRAGHDRGDAVEPAERVAHGRADVADPHDGVRVADGLQRERAVVAGAENRLEYGNPQPAGGRAGETERENVGHRVSGGDERTFSGAAEGHESRSGVEGGEAERGETGEGVRADDRTGKTVAERVRAATAGLLDKAGRVGECLRGMADDVWSYATGQRDAERSGLDLESAGGALERATEAFEPIVVRHELAVASERHQFELRQQKKVQERTKVRELRGPSLG